MKQERPDSLGRIADDVDEAIQTYKNLDPRAVHAMLRALLDAAADAPVSLDMPLQKDIALRLRAQLAELIASVQEEAVDEAWIVEMN